MRYSGIVPALVLSLLLAGCGDDGEGAGGADAGGATEFDIVVSEPRFVVPSDGLPPEVEVFSSNNNVDIIRSEGRLFMAWRSAPNHFAGTETRLYIVSSTDGGTTWQHEHTIHIGADMREPRFLDFAGFLQLLFFEAGTNPGAFEPMRMLRVRRLGAGEWSEIEVLNDAGEVPWDVKIHGDRAYLTSYMGEHYGSGEISEVSVFFQQSFDGTTWLPVGDDAEVYFGGVSEVAFEFDRKGDLYAVTRNEDGDETGFGSHVCFAPAEDLGDWECPDESDPERYDSPEMFRHGDDLYMVARRDLGGPYDQGQDHLPLAERRSRYLIDYSLRPKRTALYRVDRESRSVEHVFDLPGAGDTAFPSVIQTGPHSYLLANYTSPLDEPNISWLRGQTSDRGTQLYLLDIAFVPYEGPPRTATPRVDPTPLPTATPGEVDERLVDLVPVFADPGTPLSIDWQAGAVGLIDLGDGTRIGPETAEHVYAAAPAIYRVEGSVQGAGAASDLAGVIARTGVRAITPLNGFRLTDPDEPIVQQVIQGVIPAFYWAQSGAELAFATDPTGTAAFGFEQVTVAPLVVEADGSFQSEPVDFVLELSGGLGDATGLFIALVDATWEGRVERGILVGPMALRSGIVTEDIVAATVAVAGLDAEAALEFMAGLFGFDPADPPATIPVEAELTLAPPIE